MTYNTSRMEIGDNKLGMGIHQNIHFNSPNLTYIKRSFEKNIKVEIKQK